MPNAWDRWPEASDSTVPMPFWLSMFDPFFRWISWGRRRFLGLWQALPNQGISAELDQGVPRRGSHSERSWGASEDGRQILSPSAFNVSHFTNFLFYAKSCLASFCTKLGGAFGRWFNPRTQTLTLTFLVTRFWGWTFTRGGGNWPQSEGTCQTAYSHNFMENDTTL